MNFSRKYGFEKEPIIQIDSMNDNLRRSIWNILYSYYFKDFKDYYYIEDKLFERIWDEIFREDLDLLDSYSSNYILDKLKQKFKRIEWYKIFDLLQILIKNTKFSNVLINDLNRCLERENSGYRIIGDEFCRITDDIEITAVKEAIDNGPDIVSEQLKKALKFLSDRKNPDYKNSVRESINAVESLCKIKLDKDKSLGDALKVLKEEYNLNPALVESFRKVYGFTSNDVRHGSKGEWDEIDYDLAKYMVVSCSAFINYLLIKLDFSE